MKKNADNVFRLTGYNMCTLAFHLAGANNINVRINASKKKAGKDWWDNFLKRHLDLSVQ